MLAKVLLLLSLAVIGHCDPETLSQEMIDYINGLDTTWKAGPSFIGKDEKYVRRLCGALEGKMPPVKEITPLDAIPDEFDARTNWPNCKSIGDIRDQADCGSCWAFGAVEAMSDRYCISFGMQVNISAQDMNSCCKTCGDGCDGGFPGAAWEHWVSRGVVTGGQYDSHSGCMPYSLPHCDHHEPGPYPNCSGETRTPVCTARCESSYDSTYEKDKHYGEKSYSIAAKVDHIQTEIMTNGPVESAFRVYADFPTYRSGVYQHTTGKYLGGHAIRILGWGVESGTPYWLVANSWNPSWGDHGYFKIIRGKDEVGIESSVVAGMPKKFEA